MVIVFNIGHLRCSFADIRGKVRGFVLRLLQQRSVGRHLKSKCPHHSVHMSQPVVVTNCTLTFGGRNEFTVRPTSL